METSLQMKTEDGGGWGAARDLGVSLAYERGYVHWVDGHRDTETSGAECIKALLGDLAPIISGNANGGYGHYQWFDTGTTMLNIRWSTYINDNTVSIIVASASQEEAHKYREMFWELCPSIPITDDLEVPIRFWALRPDGTPDSSSRKVAVQPWEQLCENYPTSVRDELLQLLAVERPESGGKLILWHGPPGTGKTHFLRCLAYHWRNWCDVSYIVDPEEMLDKAHYMMATTINSAQHDRYHLLVLEDTGEFMLSDAKQRTGQGLSRLLNLTDGLVGQGLRLLVLMTTNEKLNSLHEAVARPGRCLAEIGFTEFNDAEARSWLKQQGIEKYGTSNHTLADLFEIVNQDHILTHNQKEVSIGQYA